MQHPDDGDLALLALGIHHLAPAGAAVDPFQEIAQHVAGCEECRAEVSELARAVELARQGDLGELMPPPPHVWESIAAELGLGQHSGSQSVDAELIRAVHLVPDDGPSPRPAQVRPGRPHRAMPETGSGRESQPARRRHPAARTGLRRQLARALPAVAAAVVVGVVGALVGYALRVPPPATPTPAAAAALAAVPGGPGTASEIGEARLLRTAEGVRVAVDASGLPNVAGAYEVWLFGPDGRMVSLGVLDRGVGDFVVPHGIDPSAYRTVDISDEPADGNPAHSGVSVLRGVLT